MAVLEKNAKVSFTIIETEDGIKAKSIIMIGEIVEEADKRQIVLEKLVEKFVPEIAWTQAKSGIPFAYLKTSAYRIQCAHISGKWIDKPEGR